MVLVLNGQSDRSFLPDRVGNLEYSSLGVVDRSLGAAKGDISDVAIA